MNTKIVLLISLLLSLCLACGTGCDWSKSKCNPTTWFKAKEVKATQPTGFLGKAGEQTSSKLSPMFSVGAALIAAGVLGGLLLRSAGFGASLAGTGFSLITTGVLFTEYPWITLLIPLTLILFIVYVGMLILKSKEQASAIATITAAVDAAGAEGKRVKEIIASMGRDVQNTVRNVIEPYKAPVTA